MLERVYIYEPCGDGHRFFYVRLLLEAAVREGLKPVLVTRRDDAEGASFATHLAELAPELITINSEAETYRFGIGTRNLVKLTGDLDLRRSVVIVPDFDWVLPQYIATRILRPWRPFRCVGLVMRAEVTGNRALVKKLLCGFASAAFVRSLRIMHLVGALAYDASDGRSVPDPAPSHPPAGSGAALESKHEPTLARLQSVRSAGRPVIAIIGRLDERKGVAAALAALEELRSRGVDAVLALLGAQTASVARTVADFIQRHPQVEPSIAMLPRLLSDEELRAALSAASLGLLLYQNADGPSGMLSQMMTSGIPVVASGNRYCRDVLRRMPQYGVYVELAEASCVADAVESVLQLPRPDYLAGLPGAHDFSGRLLSTARALSR